MSWLLAIYFFLLCPGTPASKETTGREELTVIMAEEGEHVNVTCQFHYSVWLGIYLKRTVGKPMDVLYFSVQGNMKNETHEYVNRTEYFRVNNTATITLRQVKPSDSDVYVCEGAFLISQKEPVEKTSSFIMLAVKASDNKLGKNSSSPWMLCALIIQSFLLVAVLLYFMLRLKNKKKNGRKSKEGEVQYMVYEDMTGTQRHHSPTETNVYYT